MSNNLFQDINDITKKHPTWRRVFLLWAAKDENLDTSQLNGIFDKLIINKQLLNDEINIDYAMSLINENNISILEKFDDKINTVLHKKQKENFIKSLKTKTYHHLFTPDVESEIHTILDNNISISALKLQFFNKLASFKTSDDLLFSLIQFKTKNISWNKEYYINRINEDQLNVKIIEDKDNKLIIQVNDYRACLQLGSQAWCIVRNEKYFNNYIGATKRQMIQFDFNLPIENNDSIIGATVAIDGSIAASYLKNDRATPYQLKNKFKLKALNEKEIIALFNFGDGEYAFNIITDPRSFLYLKKSNPRYDDLIYELEKYRFKMMKILLENEQNIRHWNVHKAFIAAIQKNKLNIVLLLLDKKVVNPCENNNESLLLAIELGQKELVRAILKDDRVDPSLNNNIATRTAAHKGFAQILAMLLKDPKVDPSVNNNECLFSACGNKFVSVVKVLLDDGRVDPTALNNRALQEAVSAGALNIIKALDRDKRIDFSYDNNSILNYTIKFGIYETWALLLSNEKVSDSLTINWVTQNIREDMQPVCIEKMKELGCL